MRNALSMSAFLIHLVHEQTFTSDIALPGQSVSQSERDGERERERGRKREREREGEREIKRLRKRGERE
jgi:hypothetical protein